MKELKWFKFDDPIPDDGIYMNEKRDVIDEWFDDPTFGRLPKFYPHETNVS